MKKLYILVFCLWCIHLTPLFAQNKNNLKRPNIVLILADDMGYSDIGCFGASTHTPVLDQMSASGLTMTHFYNASRCCPTRASLLTGLAQHQAGVGDMVNTRPEPAYQGYLNNQCVTIAEALKAGGYATYMAGKWHLGQAKENWPTRRGFDHYFGLIDGANSYFENRPYRPNQQLTIALEEQAYTPGKDYYSTDAYTQFAIQFIQQNQQPNQPFFLYLAYQAPHWPLHALPEDIAKYKGSFMKGWEVLRQERFDKQKKLGIIPASEQLSPRDPSVPEWNSISQKEKEDWDEKMAVYAAMVDRMDQNIGKLKAAIKAMGQEDNTIYLFLSDNGGSSESINGPGFGKDILAAAKLPAANPTSFTAYAYEGANVSNTPFRSFKHWEHEGGTATPFIVYGPSWVRPQLNHQSAHISDIMNTCLELAKLKYPSTYKGQAITPSTGKSLVPVFEKKKWNGHDAIYFEHEGNRAVIAGDWKIVSNYPDTSWELYHLSTDRAELHNLAANFPKRLQTMNEMYLQWAKKVGVIPFEQLDKKRPQDKF